MDFNSHAHVERDINNGSGTFKVDISTHTLTWSVTGAKLDDNAVIGNFNSHAHVERDNYLYQDSVNVTISTHTLTWSVTDVGAAIIYALQISTHTLTWSVTLDVVYIWCLLNVMRTYFFI